MRNGFPLIKASGGACVGNETTVLDHGGGGVNFRACVDYTFPGVPMWGSLKKTDTPCLADKGCLDIPFLGKRCPQFTVWSGFKNFVQLQTVFVEGRMFLFQAQRCRYRFQRHHTSLETRNIHEAFWASSEGVGINSPNLLGPTLSGELSTQCHLPSCSWPSPWWKHKPPFPLVMLLWLFSVSSLQPAGLPRTLLLSSTPHSFLMLVHNGLGKRVGGRTSCRWGGKGALHVLLHLSFTITTPPQA